MTNAEEILQAVSTLVKEHGKKVFSRKDIRDQIGVNQDTWLSSYTAIFQGMRVDHPGGAPPVGKRYKGVFRQVSRGKHTLTEYGKQLIGLENNDTQAATKDFVQIPKVDIKTENKKKTNMSEFIIDRETDFRGAKVILLNKGLYDEILETVKSLPTTSLSVGEINSIISKSLAWKGWRKTRFEYPNTANFEHDFFKNSVAIEVELSFINKTYHELVRLYIAYKHKKIDVGVILTNRTLDNISGRNLAAYAFYDKMRKWIQIADLDVPIYLIGIR